MVLNWSYAVLGTGALGGLYGGLLANAGMDVHFLLRSDFQHVREQGLRVDSPLGDFRLASPNIYERAAQMPKVDVAIVAWKATANSHLGEALRHVCHSDTRVLVLQNGWDVESTAAAVVGAERVLGGCCFLCSNKIAPGHIRHLDYGRIAFGEYASSLAGQITPRMKDLSEQFQQAKIDMRPAANLSEVRWKKLVWNIPFNGLSVVLDSDTKLLMQDSGSCRLVEDLMHEVVQSAAVCGTEISASHVEKMLADTRKMVAYDSSMLLDYRARRPIEVEAIVGNSLRAAQAAGYRPRKIEMLYQELFYMDRQNRSDQAH